MCQLRPPAQWSSAVEAADWIAERIGPFGAGVTSVVPAGFGAYARILHPAEEAGHGDRLVRWREVAAWSGVALCPDAQFHTIALPPEAPATPAPWRGQGPREGRLYLPDAEVLAEIIRVFTTTPETCFFGVWDGYGWGGVQFSSSRAPAGARRRRTQPVTIPDPVPDAVREGLRVRLPGRDHLLYTGPAEAITAPVDIGRGQTANLAWPEDHAWCIASEIDLAWTYVGGTRALVDRLVADERIETLRAGPDDPLTRVEPFVAGLVERATDELLASRHTVIATSRGSVEAWLEEPTRWRKRAIRVRAGSDSGVSYGDLGPVHRREDLRQAVRFRLTGAVVGLVGG